MKRTFSDGTHELVLEPHELLRRLCALIPPPRVHQIRYHGVFAPNARGRRAVTRQQPSRRARVKAALADGAAEQGETPTGLAPPGRGSDPAPAPLPTSLPPLSEAPTTAPTTDDDLGGPPPSPRRDRYLPWAELLRRVHEVDVLRCRRCLGRRRIIAFLTDPQVVRAILEHLRLPAEPPSVAPARAPPQADLVFAGWSDDHFIDPPVGEPA
jgi:hypothetical protein